MFKCLFQDLSSSAVFNPSLQADCIFRPSDSMSERTDTVGHLLASHVKSRDPGIDLNESTRPGLGLVSRDRPTKSKKECPWLVLARVAPERCTVACGKSSASILLTSTARSPRRVRSAGASRSVTTADDVFSLLLTLEIINNNESISYSNYVLSTHEQ